jgi:hypothetical protein
VLLKALAEVFSFSTAAHLALKSRIKIPSIVDVWKHTVFLGYSLFFFVGWTYKPQAGRNALRKGGWLKSSQFCQLSAAPQLQPSVTQSYLKTSKTT